jgi:hypothetical protein
MNDSFFSCSCCLGKSAFAVCRKCRITLSSINVAVFALYSNTSFVLQTPALYAVAFSAAVTGVGIIGSTCWSFGYYWVEPVVFKVRPLVNMDVRRPEAFLGQLA